MKSVIPPLFLLLSLAVCLGAPDPAGPDSTAALLAAAGSGDLERGRTLLEAGTLPDCRDREGWTPLIHAARRGDLEFSRLLVAKGADVNGQSSSVTGSRVFSFATGSGNLQLLDFLLEKGAEINGQARDGNTALNYAASHHQLEAARYLLDHGAKVNMLCYRNERHNVFTPLLGAVLQGDIEMARLLISRGARLEQRNNRGSTVLMEAAKLPRPDLVQLLIEKGANVNARGPQGHTALIYAGYNGREENIRLLLKAGADPTAEATDAVFPDTAGTYDGAKVARQQGHAGAFELLSAAKASHLDNAP